MDQVKEAERTRRQFTPIGWVLLSYVCLYGIYTFFGQGLPGNRSGILDVGLVVPPAAAAVLAWMAAARSESRREAWSWRCVSAAELCWALGQATWAFYEIALSVPIPYPSLADVFWILFYPFSFAALVLQVPVHRLAPRRLISVLDAMLFTLGIAALSWQFVLMPALNVASDPLSATLAVAYPVGDLFLVFALASLILCWAPERVPTWLCFLLGAFGAEIVSDTGFMIATLSGTYHVGTPADALWPIGNLLISWAAISRLTCQHASPDTDRTPHLARINWTRVVHLLLPYLALPAAAVLLYVGYFASSDPLEAPERPIMVMATLLVTLVMLRQLSMLIDNSKMSITLMNVSAELEARVEELTKRTTELATMNRVATSLSNCQTPEEVLNTGLEVLGDTTEMRAGFVYLIQPDGAVTLAAHQGIMDDALPVLSGLPHRVPDVMANLASGKSMRLKRSEIAALPIPPELVERSGAGALVVPLLSRGISLGAMVMLGDTEEICSRTSLQLAEAVGAELGVTYENAVRYGEARYLADRDPVTGLLNHRAIHQRLDQELARCERNGNQFSVLMIDVDGFKQFNDTYGHPAGDQMLRKVADLLYDSCRGSDVVGRYGGDEFVAILPETGSFMAMGVAQRLCSSLAQNPYLPDDGSQVQVRLSIGIATYPEDGTRSQDLMEFADSNLYESKQRGGNTIVSARSSPISQTEHLGY